MNIPLLVSLCLLPPALVAQSPGQNLLQQQQAQVETYFLAHHPDLTDWFDGPEHHAQYPYVGGFPFWISADWQLGNVQTTTYFYEQLLLRYDAYLDVLVYSPDPQSQQMVQLDPTDIQSFSLLGLNFVYVGEEADWPGMTAAGLKPAYLELMYSGTHLLLAKREKFIQKEQSNASYPENFAARSQYYVYHQREFHPLQGKKDLYALFPEQKARIKEYLKKDSLRMRRITRFSFQELNELMAFCESQ